MKGTLKKLLFEKNLKMKTERKKIAIMRKKQADEKKM